MITFDKIPKYDIYGNLISFKDPARYAVSISGWVRNNKFLLNHRRCGSTSLFNVIGNQIHDDCFAIKLNKSNLICNIDWYVLCHDSFESAIMKKLTRCIKTQLGINCNYNQYSMEWINRKQELIDAGCQFLIESNTKQGYNTLSDMHSLTLTSIFRMLSHNRMIKYIKLYPLSMFNSCLSDWSDGKVSVFPHMNKKTDPSANSYFFEWSDITDDYKRKLQDTFLSDIENGFISNKINILKNIEV